MQMTKKAAERAISMTAMLVNVALEGCHRALEQIDRLRDISEEACDEADRMETHLLDKLADLRRAHGRPAR